MKKRMLFIGFNKLYSNPNLSVTLAVLADIMDLDFFGPGYTPNSALEEGINEFILSKNYSYDYLVCDSFVFEWENIHKRTNRFGGTALFFDNQLYDQYAPLFKIFFLKSELHKIFISNWDYYNISNHQITEIIENNIWVLGTDKSVIKSYDEIKSNYVTTNNWYEFTHAYEHRIISSPHFIGYNEFNNTPLEHRKLLFDVPGTEYEERKEVIRLTRLKKKLHYKVQKMQNVLFQILRRKPSRNIINYFNNSFNNKISDTKFCYVSGSSLKYPIRKYFEVPSKGTLLICSPFIGMEDLGFKNNINCIFLEELEDIIDVINGLNLIKAQNIANNGYNFILKNHSSNARREQWKSSFELLDSGTFKGSTWIKGKYLNL